MKKLALILGISLVCLSVIAAGCSSTKTLTVTATQTISGGTITVPGGVTTLPAVTVTLPGNVVTTIVATTITVAPVTTTIEQTTVPAGLVFLPTTPAKIPYGMTLNMGGNCLFCHGKGEVLEFPTPPVWDGTVANYANYNIYSVVPGSIQDHTGRLVNVCLNCHDIVG
jgi:hypothetical protein